MLLSGFEHPIHTPLPPRRPNQRIILVFVVQRHHKPRLWQPLPSLDTLDDPKPLPLAHLLLFFLIKDRILNTPLNTHKLHPLPSLPRRRRDFLLQFRA